MNAMKRISVTGLAGLLILSLGACGKKEEAAPAKGEAKPGATEPAGEAKPAAKPAAAVSDAVLAEAKTLFSQRCTACHGDSGKGDGPGAAALNPKPQNYTDSEWQASVSDEDIAKVIVQGGLAVGKSPIMPANPDLKDKTELVNGLVSIIRDFEE